MAAFRFTLDPLLRLRKMEEDGCRRQVAEIERERQALEDRIRSQQSLIAEGKQQMRGVLVGRLDVGSLRFQASASMQVSRKTRQIVVKLAGVHQRLARARERLTEAMRARRAVELLREQRYEAWKQEENRKEILAMDELARRKELFA